MYDHNGGIYVGWWRIASQEDDFEETLSDEEMIKQAQSKRHLQILATIGDALVSAGTKLKTRSGPNATIATFAEK